MADYRISRRIGRGGMAEVFIALQESIGGFEKLVVIKRIFKHFCQDASFVEMFLNEARLAASIRHPNVVEILDINKDDDGYFIVMEYLSGENLAYVYEELADRGTVMPAHLVCRVGAELAGGLHSAHIATDVSGALQPIIHRDVTPSNAIVCFNGVVKLVDFGVAKAQVGDRQTRPGVLKGKLEYLAPEQVQNQPVSPATDVFQLGVVLHELLTGQRLFEADSDHAILNAVLEREIPAPSSVRDDLPRQLDDVILQALERDPNKRTQSADELRKGLEAVMRDLGTVATQRSLGEWVSATFEGRKRERVKVERECVQQVRERREPSEIPAVLAPFAPTGPGVAKQEPSSAATRVERPTPGAPKSSGLHNHQPRRIYAAVAALALAVVGYLWLVPAGSSSSDLRSTGQRIASTDPVAAIAPVEPERSAGSSSSTGPAPSAGLETDAKPGVVGAEDAGHGTYEARIEVSPATAAIYLDGVEAGTGRLVQTLLRDGQTHRISVRAPGYESQTVVFVDAPPPSAIELVRVPVAEAKIERRQRSPSRKADKTTVPGVESKTRAGGRDNNTKPADSGRKLPATDNRNPWTKSR